MLYPMNCTLLTHTKYSRLSASLDSTSTLPTVPSRVTLCSISSPATRDTRRLRLFWARVDSSPAAQHQSRPSLAQEQQLSPQGLPQGLSRWASR